MRSDVQEHLVADERARSSVIQAHFDRLRRDEAPRPHDEFGAAFPVVLQVRVDEPLHHVALTLANLRHVDLDRAGHHAELGAGAREMRDLGAVNFVLAWQACDVGARAADPFALDDRSALPRSPMCQAVSLPPPPLPRMRTSRCSG